MPKSTRALLLGTLISLAIGVGGGYFGEALHAPFYFGAFFGFVLAGLVTLFAVAAIIANEQAQGK